MYGLGWVEDVEWVATEDGLCGVCRDKRRSCLEAAAPVDAAGLGGLNDSIGDVSSAREVRLSFLEVFFGDGFPTNPEVTSSRQFSGNPFVNAATTSGVKPTYT